MNSKQNPDTGEVELRLSGLNVTQSFGLSMNPSVMYGNAYTEPRNKTSRYPKQRKFVG